jgi:hypothetical protein
MVLIDTVYQRVLALANKEQRGYITPQEFNLFANQAQLEIVDKYFVDINQLSRMPGNKEEYSDMVDNLDERLGVLKTESGSLNITGGRADFPIDLYMLGSVFKNNVNFDQLNPNEIRKINKSNLTRPSRNRPVYSITDNGINIFPPSAYARVDISYTRRPNTVAWGYVVINNRALYDPSELKTTNFELHPSEETELVYKILKLSGVAIQRNQVAQFGQAMEKELQQQEKQ